MLISLITLESLEPSCLDILGSISGSILNERSSQAPSSRMSESILTESHLSESLNSYKGGIQQVTERYTDLKAPGD